MKETDINRNEIWVKSSDQNAEPQSLEADKAQIADELASGLDFQFDVQAQKAVKPLEADATDTFSVTNLEKATNEPDYSRVSDASHELDAGENPHKHRHHHHHHHHHHHSDNGESRENTTNAENVVADSNNHVHHSEHKHPHKSTHKNKKRKKTRSGRKKTGRIILIILLCLLVAAGGVGMYIYQQYKAAMSGEKTVAPRYTDEELGIDPRVAKELNGYRLITIYGLDNTKRSDVILIMAIDKETKHGEIFTVYRDTYMQLNPDEVYSFSNGDNDFFKCNHAYKKGKMITSIKMLNRHMDLNIREAVGLDWDAVASLVDELGGIDVHMPWNLVEFIFGGDSEEDTIIWSDGTAHLNGEQAVRYLRTRKDPGSTAVTRSERNLAVFLDLFERAKTMDKKEVMDIFTATIGKVETNMRLQEMLAMLKDIRSYELEAAPGWPYSYDILWDDAFYYYVPTTLEANVYQLHQRMFKQDGYQPTETALSLSKKIAKKSHNLAAY